MEKNYALLLAIIFIWTLPWKGVALWKAARNGSKGWFIALLILNSLAVLEILYIFIFARESRVERIKLSQRQ